MPDLYSSEIITKRFHGRTALVTGAAGGIGLSIAHRLAREGCRVLLTDIDGSRLQYATAAFADLKAEIATEVADLADKEQCTRLVPTLLERWGRIDVLVNNAAYHGPRTPFMSLDMLEWERIFAVNVTAAVLLSREAARNMMSRRDGAIINVTSVQLELPVPTYSAYVSSKGAILGLTRALAVELSPNGIRVNAVTPGVIATEAFQETLMHHREQKDFSGAAGSGSPGGETAALLLRYGTASEVANAVAFLASSEASFITGTTLHVDGGRSISRRSDPFEVAFGKQSIHGKI